MEHLNSFAKALKELLITLQYEAGYTADCLKVVADRYYLALRRFRSRQPLALEDFLLVRTLVPAIDPNLVAGTTK